ncbi:MAG: ribonuclease domain-containing protein [Cyclobacteriaceae bacterium]
MQEIKSTIDRIKTNKPKYSQDGLPYANDYKIDPNSQILNTAYNYVEWTVKTPGISGRAQRRIVVNKTTSQAYYTHDHYKNFIEISLKDF